MRYVAAQHTRVAGIRNHTSQELEGCWVQLVNRGIDVDGRAAFLAVQPGALLIVAHGGSVGPLSLFWASGRRAADQRRGGRAAVGVGQDAIISSARVHGLPARGRGALEGKRV
jgi:hypothetical protein